MLGGYTRVTKGGKAQVMVKTFLNALLAAQGVQIQVGRTPGKSAKYKTTVHTNGVVLIGRTYTDKFGLQPGDELEIALEDDGIKLYPLEAEALPPLQDPTPKAA